jgi:hypothetical protein
VIFSIILGILAAIPLIVLMRRHLGLLALICTAVLAVLLVFHI